MNTKGFTLIELLVVVLIIGILWAVALPQYQGIVLRSRAAKLWTNLSALKKAGKIYCLENPSTIAPWSEIKNDLSIEVSDSDNFTYGGFLICMYAYYQPKLSPSIFEASYSDGSNSFTIGYDAFEQRYCDGDICPKLGIGERVCMLNSDGSVNNCFYVEKDSIWK